MQLDINHHSTESMMYIT